MNSLDEYNIIVNGTPLGNAWRKTASILATVRDGNSSTKGAAIEFIIEGDGDTVAEIEESLAQRKAQTEREFNLSYPDCRGFRTVDDEDNWLFHFHPGDRESLKITSSVSELPQESPTKNTLYMILEIVCDISQATPGGGGSGATAVPDIKGLTAGTEFSVVEDVGGNKIVVLTGTFTAIKDPTNLGPLTITGIAEGAGGDAGYPVLTLSAPHGGGDLTDKYVEISGTAIYNGQWLIKGSAASAITLDTDFIGNDTTGGIANVGVNNTASDLFDAGMTAMLTFMGVGDNGLTLDHRAKVDLVDGSVEFALGASTQDFVPGGIGDGDTMLVRSIQMATSRSEAQAWETSGDLDDIGSSTPPKSVTVEGLIALNRLSPSYTNDLRSLWTSVKADVLTRVAAHLGHAFTVSAEKISFDGGLPGIGFILEGVGDFNDVVSIEYTRGVSVPQTAFVYSRGALHGVQFQASEAIHQITRTISRLGVGEVDLTRTAPTETGYYFLDNGSSESVRGPLSYEGLGSNLYLQTRTESYLRLKLV